MSFLNLASSIPLLIVAALALITARYTVRDGADASHKFSAIDGLRGLLALLVFIHHSDFWYHYNHQEGWVPSGTVFYNNLGMTSITLFFMLSGFLFTYKLLEGRNQPVDWLRLYCSRFLRLTPLYLCLVAAIVTIIALEAHFVRTDDWATLINQITQWLLFTAKGHPNINQHPDTYLMTAGVVWTLPFEWYFYFCLPLLGALLGTKSKPNAGLWLIASCLCFVLIKMETALLYGFLGGGIAAFAVWHPWPRKYFSTKYGNWLVIPALIFTYRFIDPYISWASYLRLFILTLCMAFIANGTNLFGLLDNRATRALSTISYGVYLLHGLLLYMVMSHLVPIDTRAQLSPQNHWLIVFACTPVLIGLASLSWHLIEKPALNQTSRLANLIKKMHSGTEASRSPTE